MKRRRNLISSLSFISFVDHLYQEKTFRSLGSTLPFISLMKLRIFNIVVALQLLVWILNSKALYIAQFTIPNFWLHFTLFAVDIHARSCVRLVISDRSGMGKSLYIKHLAENLKYNLQRSADAVHVTIPLHGPVVTPDTVLELFIDQAKNPTCCIYQIDIAPNVRCNYWSGLALTYIVMQLNRCYGKWIPFYSACSSCVDYVIVKEECGAAIQTSFMQLRSPYRTEKMFQTVIRFCLRIEPYPL